MTPREALEALCTLALQGWIAAMGGEDPRLTRAKIASLRSIIETALAELEARQDDVAVLVDEIKEEKRAETMQAVLDAFARAAGWQR